MASVAYCSICVSCIFLLILREVGFDVSTVSELLQSLLCVSTAVKSFPFSSPILLLSTLSPSLVSWVEDHDDGDRRQLIECVLVMPYYEVTRGTEELYFTKKN